VRLVASKTRVEQDFVAVRNDARRNEVKVLKDFVAQAMDERARNAFVSPAENGNAATASMKFAGEHLRHGGFAGAADREVADAGDHTTELLRTYDTAAVKRQPCLHGTLVSCGQSPEDKLKSVGAPAFTTLEDHVYRIAFESFEQNAHGKSGDDGDAGVVGS
jgi:hypothetical protein